MENWELEEQKRRAAWARQMAQQGGMVNQGSAPQMSPNLTGQTKMADLMRAAAFDPSGEQGAISAQRDLGAQMMNRQAPQGRQMGNVYAGPNWAESLDYGLSRGMGAYNLAKARKAQSELNTRTANAGEAKGAVALENWKREEARKAAAERRAEAETEQSGAKTYADIRQGDEKLDIDREGMAHTKGYDYARLGLDRDRLAQDTSAHGDMMRLRETEIDNELAEWQAKRETLIRENGLDREHKEQMEAMRQAAAANPLANMTGPERRKINEEHGVFNKLAGAVTAAEKVRAEGGTVGGWRDIPIEFMKNTLGLGAGQMVTSVMYDENEMAVRGAIDEAVEKYRRAFTGANLTFMERSLGDNWDPTIPGVGTDDKIIRARALLDSLNTNRSVYDLSMLELPEEYDPSKTEEVVAIESRQSDLASKKKELEEELKRLRGE